MAEEPGHKAMLYFLEVLMNSNGALTISQLAGRFGSRSFTSEMRQAAGGNESGLKKFMLRYPSLFTVNGNMVSLCNNPSGTTAVSSVDSETRSALPDVSQHMEAVSYFQQRLSKRDERWIPIKSLAGHISQAPAVVRNAVGPQLDFRNWLLRHPHIFEVQGDNVGLRDGVAAITTPNLHKKSFEQIHYNGTSSSGAAGSNGAVKPLGASKSLPSVPPRTPPAQRRSMPPKSPAGVRRSHSFSEKKAQQIGLLNAGSSTAEFPANSPTTGAPVRRRNPAPTSVTSNEYKAVLFLKDLIERRGPVHVQNISSHYSAASESVRSAIGWSTEEIDVFLKKNASVFSISEEDLVFVVKNAKVPNSIISNSRPTSMNPRTKMGKGKIFHVAKLWGIVDLGKHEHVFFDKSIMRKNLEDLQKEYHPGEVLCFNAIMAPRGSRAKWRAIQVWRENESQPLPWNDSEAIMSPTNNNVVLSPSNSVEDELNKVLPDRFADAAQSAAGVVPVWNFKSSREEPMTPLDIDMISENTYMNSSSLIDTDVTSAFARIDMEQVGRVAAQQSKIETAAAMSGAMGDRRKQVKTPYVAPAVRRASTGAADARKNLQLKDVSCQTVSTGEIIATQFYHDTTS